MPRDTIWRLGARDLPPPAGASETLRESIAKTAQPDPGQFQIAPQSEEEWLAVIAQMDAGKVDAARDLVDRLPISVDHDEIDEVNVFVVSPADVDPRHADHTFVYVHGGAFVLNAGEAGLPEAILIAHRTKMRVLSIDYRMPPRHPAPAGRDDVVTVYRHLLEQRPAQAIALGGSSGGGNLAMVTVQRLKEMGIDIPGALYLGTPGADMSKTGDSYYLNEGVDRVLPVYEGFVEAASRLYANGHALTDPQVSPLYGDLAGFPPTLLITGTRDLLLSATAAYSHQAPSNGRAGRDPRL